MCYCCDMLCMFSLLTCCGCRDRVTRSLIFFPPSASYEIVEQTPESADNATSRASKKETKSTVELRMKPRFESRTLNNDRVDEWKEFNCRPSDFHTMVLRTRKGEYIPGYFISHPEAVYTLLFAHGNAADIGLMRCHLMDMRSVLRVNIMAFEYSGYGTSTGKASESNTYADVESAYHYLVKERGILPSCIIGYGQSLGTAVVVHLANNFEVAGIILHSPLMSCLRVLEPFDRTFWFDAYPVIEQIQNVFVPVFVIHGQLDDQIPMVHGEILSKLAPNMPVQPWFVEGANHNNIEIVARDELYARIDGFMMKIADDSNAEDFHTHITLPLTAENLDHNDEYNQFVDEQLVVSSQKSPHSKHSADEVETDETSGLLRSVKSGGTMIVGTEEEKKAGLKDAGGRRSDSDNTTTLSEYEDLSGTDQRPPQDHDKVSEINFGSGFRSSINVGSVDTSPTHNSNI